MIIYIYSYFLFILQGAKVSDLFTSPKQRRISQYADYAVAYGAEFRRREIFLFYRRKSRAKRAKKLRGASRERSERREIACSVERKMC